MSAPKNLEIINKSNNNDNEIVKNISLRDIGDLPFNISYGSELFHSISLKEKIKHRGGRDHTNPNAVKLIKDEFFYESKSNLPHKKNEIKFNSNKLITTIQNEIISIEKQTRKIEQ